MYNISRSIVIVIVWTLFPLFPSKYGFSCYIGGFVRNAHVRQGSGQYLYFIHYYCSIFVIDMSFTYFCDGKKEISVNTTENMCQKSSNNQRLRFLMSVLLWPKQSRHQSIYCSPRFSMSGRHFLLTHEAVAWCVWKWKKIHHYTLRVTKYWWPSFLNKYTQLGVWKWKNYITTLCTLLSSDEWPSFP